MDSDLAVCRAIMRIYSFFKMDSFGRLTPRNAENISSEYFQLEPQLKDAFHKVGIQMYPCGVNSSFNGKIKIVPEVFFIDLNTSFAIPRDILCCLERFSQKNTPKNHYEEEYQLFLSYSGRWFDSENGDKFITDGLQSSTKIIIDLFTYAIASEDCLHHRLIHELLHVFGVEEEKMPQLILSACKISYEIAQPFVKKVIRRIKAIQDEFVNSVEVFMEKEPELTQHVLRLADALVSYGFPEKIDTPLYATTYMPCRLFPEPQIEGYEVLFM